MTTLTTTPPHEQSSARLPWWASVAGVGALLGLFVQYLMTYANSCEGWDCLGNWMVATAAGTVLVPLLGWIGLRLLGMPRAALTGVLGCLAGLALASAAVVLDAAVRDLEAGTGAPSWWLLPVVGAVSALAGGVVARPNTRWLVRTGVVLLVVGCAVSLTVAAESVERRHEVADFAATGVDTYLPRIPGVEPSHASAAGDSVRLTYSPADLDEWERRVELHQMNAPREVSCAIVSDVGILLDDELVCGRSGGALVAADSDTTCVAAVRGATMLVGCTDAREMVPHLSTALADAPPVSAERLAAM